MTLRTLITAAFASAFLLLVLAAAGFALLVWSIEQANHGAIRTALVEAPAADLGVPEIRSRINGFEEGYFPDCAGASILLREERWAHADEAAIRADAILPTVDGDQCIRLHAELHGGDIGLWFTYARYWHGALVLHRIVLSRADYATLQTTATVILIFAVLAFGGALARRVGWAPALAVTAALVLLTDLRAVSVIPLQATGFAALIVAVTGFAAFAAGRRPFVALIGAALAGAFLNYFDFLYSPAAFAMLNAWIWLAAVRPPDAPRGALGGLAIFAASLGGYGFFWALKWAIAFGFNPDGTEIFVFGTGEFTRWGPGHAGYFPLEAMFAVIGRMFDAWWKGALAVAIIAASAMWARYGARASAAPVRPFWLLLTPILPALLLLEALAAHTLAHTAFTFRTAPLALGIASASLIAARRQIAPDSRKAAISDAV
ncbi:hypothetical protein sos41_30910 [Alphaproteobacteria bacterium SO-S41]|nr:hypothetical protein sos41_30910 [Alphaproteobacteria bacterium SO-S41]